MLLIIGVSTLGIIIKNLRIERNKIAALYKRSKNNPENEDYRNCYKMHRNEYNKKVRNAKREN